VPGGGFARLDLFSLKGELISTPAASTMPPGEHLARLELVPGNYLLRLSAGGLMRVIKIAMIPE
jgi:hypothetical protein